VIGFLDAIVQVIWYNTNQTNVRLINIGWCCKLMKLDERESIEKNKINLEVLKNNPKLILLLKELRNCKIDIDSLNEFEVNKLLECILIVSR